MQTSRRLSSTQDGSAKRKPPDCVNAAPFALAHFALRPSLRPALPPQSHKVGTGGDRTPVGTIAAIA